MPTCSYGTFVERHFTIFFTQFQGFVKPSYLHFYMLSVRALFMILIGFAMIIATFNLVTCVGLPQVLHDRSIISQTNFYYLRQISTSREGLHSLFLSF